MPFTAADLDKILAQQQQLQEPTDDSLSYPMIRVERGPRQALAFPTKRDWLFYLLGVLFLIGVGLGTLLVNRCQPQTLELLQSVLGNYIELREVRSFVGIALSSFTALFSLLLLLFLLGFCSIAQPLILLVPLFKGLGYGFAAGSLYGKFGISAVFPIAVFLLPSMLPGAFLLMLAGRSAFLFSTRLFRSSVQQEKATVAPNARHYCLRFVLFSVLCLMVSLLDAAVCIRFRSLL